MRREAQPTSTPSDTLPDSPALFDLPLFENDGEDSGDSAGEVSPTRAAAADTPTIQRQEQPAPAPAPQTAQGLLRRRVLATLFDGAMLLAASTGFLLAAVLQGSALEMDDLPGYLMALASFSFVYTVYSLVFWEATPGMRRARLRLHSDGGSTTSPQALLRWLGTALTLLLFGLPALLAIKGGRSLADYTSGTRLGS